MSSCPVHSIKLGHVGNSLTEYTDSSEAIAWDRGDHENVILISWLKFPFLPPNLQNFCGGLGLSSVRSGA